MVISLVCGSVLPRRLGRIPDRNGPVFSRNFGHGPTCRPRADLAGAPAVGRRPDGGRTRRPSRRGRADRSAVRGPPDRPRRAGGVGARPLRRVPARPRVPHAPAHAERRGGARRAARPGRGPPGRADDGDGHGERDGRGQDPAGPARAARPQARHRARLARLHRPARRVRRPGERGPALHRRRGAPSPAGLDQVHRRRRPAQRTHLAPVRAGRSFRPVVRHGRGSRGSARTGPSGSTASRTPGPCPARSSRPPDSTRPSACSPGSPRLRTGIR